MHALDKLPVEVLIEIVSSVAYDPNNAARLQLVNRHFYDIMKCHESTLVKTILNSQFPWAFSYFPGLLYADAITSHHIDLQYEVLGKLHQRTATLAAIMSHCKVIRDRGSDHTAWTTDRAIRTHRAGLLILYRLGDCGECPFTESKDGSSLWLSSVCRNQEGPRQVPANIVAGNTIVYAPDVHPPAASHRTVDGPLPH